MPWPFLPEDPGTEARRAAQGRGQPARGARRRFARGRRGHVGPHVRWIAASLGGDKGSRIETLMNYLKFAFAIFGVLALLAIVFMNLPPRMLVEPISVPKALADQGFTETVAQQRLASSLKKVIEEAQQTMPAQIRDSIEADQQDGDIEIEGTGVSLGTITQYAKRIFGRYDAYIRGALVRSADGKYSFLFTVTEGGREWPIDPKAMAWTPKSSETSHSEPTGETGSEREADAAWHAEPGIDFSKPGDITVGVTGPSPDPRDPLNDAANQIMQQRSPFIYASALSTRARNKCYEYDADCDYDDAIASFNDVIREGASGRFYKWSWLALSKIDEDRGDYAGEVEKAMLSVALDDRFYWGYYNWGIGLAEQGCHKEALEAFTKSLEHDPVDFAYNAAGRTALDLALQSGGRANEPQRAAYLVEAQRDLEIATTINPGYAEAHINLADTLVAESSPRALEQARHQYARALLLGTSQTGRAVADLTERGVMPAGATENDVSRSVLVALEDAQLDTPECRNLSPNLAHSVLAAKGCLSLSQQERMHDAGLLRAATPFVAIRSTHDPHDCSRQSVRANTKPPRPVLLDPSVSAGELAEQSAVVGPP